MGLHEGVVISQADGYHRVSGQTCLCQHSRDRRHGTGRGPTLQRQPRRFGARGSRPGCSTMKCGAMRNVGTAARLRPEGSHAPIHEDRWGVPRATKSALMLRRAYKVAATEPGGPVYLADGQLCSRGKKNVQAQILPAERSCPLARPSGSSCSGTGCQVADRRRRL
jgi:hypothetical protein